jgi:integrase
MKAALDEGLHTEIGFQDKGFKVLREDVNMMYLTEAEIEAIRTVDLSNEPNLEDSRAVFLAGCYTAQRFSDYHRISEKHIKNGFIYLKQVKTGTEVIIPIHHKLKAILSKYKNNLPYVYDQKLNLDIKAIALKAKIKNYHQITSHTARRSGATNMYLAGLKTIEIMKITGHKTESEFLKYIKITKEETAKSLANHPYYKGE